MCARGVSVSTLHLDATFHRSISESQIMTSAVPIPSPEEPHLFRWRFHRSRTLWICATACVWDVKTNSAASHPKQRSHAINCFLP